MRIAILGAGRIGEALLAGFLGKGASPGELCFSELYPKRAAAVSERYGVPAVTNVVGAASADLVLIAVKPQDVDAVADEIALGLRPHTLIVSVAAGITTAHLERLLLPGTRVVRVMPNMALLVGEGMSAIAAGAHATAGDLSLVENLLGSVGQVVRLTESHLDAVTALSGSGPAYVFLLAEAMIEAGVLLGLPRPVATQLAVQTVLGSAVMLRDSGDSAAQLREAVTSPGGTTAAALRKLEDRGLRAAVCDAVEAARDRSRELAGG